MSKPHNETSQESFWRSSFGTEYATRNSGFADARVPFFRKVSALTGKLESACELGASVGENLRALHAVQPDVELFATEINKDAWAKLVQVAGVKAENEAILSYNPRRQFSLVFISGVLIHINPDDLPATYDQIYNLSSDYVLLNEYFNPSPVELTYRGVEGKLFKRDFAAEFWDRFKDTVRVVDYGFLWSRMEPSWDNTNWTLFKKQG